MHGQLPILGIPSFEVFEVIPVPLFVVHRSLKFSYANTAACRWLGRALNGVLGAESFGLFPSNERFLICENILSVFLTHTSSSLPICHPPSQSSLNLQLSPLFDSNGFTEAVMGVLFDQGPSPDLGQSTCDELRALVTHVESSREQERGRIAREIHDELGQSLTCMGMDLAFLSKLLDPANQDATLRMNSLGQLVKESIRCVRRISSDLRPSVLDDLGLAAAVDYLANAFESRTGIACHVEIQEDLQIESHLSTTLFRICQEAFTIVTHEAKATLVNIILVHSDDSIFLRIIDDGLGIPNGEVISVVSLGILGIRERVSGHGGTMEVFGEGGAGKTISIHFPNVQGGS